MDEAERYITVEINQTKGEDALEAAKDIYPSWEENPDIRTRIEELTGRSEALKRGLEIQQEISALRETGCQSAYQKALELLNEYNALRRNIKKD